MEITGINSLWKDYEVTALPLNPYALSEKRIDGKTVKEYYFDGYTTLDGKVRTYLKIYENPKADGIILFLPDTEGCEEPALSMYDKGFTVAILDYSGRNKENSRYTIYPKSLAGCNCRGAVEFEAPADTLNSRWFVWACMARRAIALIKKFYEKKNIFVFGVGLGGSTAYKLSAFDDGPIAAATTLNILPNVTGAGNPIINYRAALDNRSYAAATKVPLMIAVSSNDEDGSFDDMSELASVTASLKCLRIAEREFESGIKKVYDQIAAFFRNCAKGDVSIQKPQIKAINSENTLYFNINIGTNDGEKYDGESNVELFAAYCLEDPRFRNWTNVPLIGLADSEYMARVTVMQDTKPVYVFVNMTDKNNNTSSSPLLSVIPKNLGIPAQSTVKQKLIYDVTSGKDVWTCSDNGDIVVKNGPLDIMGITSSSNTLISFKPGDLLYKANPDSLLQIIACGEPQNVTVELSDGIESYISKVVIPNSTDWHKFTLASTDFKGPSGQLTDFSKAVLIKFTSEKEFMISSMLWV